MNPREICERYEKLYTGRRGRHPGREGFRRQCLGPGLATPLSGATRCGFAFPALGEACAESAITAAPIS